MAKRKVESEETRVLKDVPFGEFVRIIRAGKPGKKVYQLVEYDRTLKSYCLQNAEDCCDVRYVDKTTKVLVGFTY